jgi:hypothetical protein
MRHRLLIAVGLLALTTGSARATPIVGTLNLTGSGGVTFTSSQALFSYFGNGNVTFGNETGSFSELGPCSNCVTFGTPTATMGMNAFNYSPLDPGGSLVYSLNDGQYVSTLTLTAVTFEGKASSNNFSLEGTGVLTLTGFDPTAGTFDLTAQGDSTNASFSSTSTAIAVPEPASAAVVGLGLIGLGLAARKRRETLG